MQFMLLLYVSERPQPGTPEAAAAFGAIRAFHEELGNRNVLIGSNPLQAPDAARTVRVRGGGRPLITDGPFAETKEWLGGYFLVECDGLDHALELAALCPTAADGSVEVRPVIDTRG
jgi:hypothetical protein